MILGLFQAYLFLSYVAICFYVAGKFISHYVDKVNNLNDLNQIANILIITWILEKIFKYLKGILLEKANRSFLKDDLT